MKVLVVSEGKHELDPDSYQGALVELTRRMLKQEVEFKRMKASDRVVNTHALRGKFTDYGKRALRWVSYAQREGYDALVFVIDQDGHKKRETGVENAQNHDRFSISRAMAVAIQSFDAWMLADERALSKVLDVTVQRQKDPESNKHPKSECENIIANSQRNMGLTEFYFQVAKVIKFDRLRERCPKGFGPFQTRVEELFPD